MNVKQLLQRINDALQKGEITEKSKVLIGVPHEIYYGVENFNRPNKKAWIPGSVTSVETEGANSCVFPPEDDIPSHFEIVVSTKDMKGIYNHETLVCS